EGIPERAEARAPAPSGGRHRSFGATVRLSCVRQRRGQGVGPKADGGQARGPVIPLRDLRTVVRVTSVSSAERTSESDRPHDRRAGVHDDVRSDAPDRRAGSGTTTAPVAAGSGAEPPGTVGIRASPYRPLTIGIVTLVLLVAFEAMAVSTVMPEA